MWELLLEHASKVENAISAAIVALTVGCFALVKGKISSLQSKLIMGAVVILGVSPLATLYFVRVRGLYHIRVTVMLVDGQPSNEAELSSSVGGEFKKMNKSWEYDLPPQVKSSTETVTLYASLPEAYLAGRTEIKLGDDFYPTAVIHLSPLPNAWIRGVVVDPQGHSIKAAKVSEVGFPGFDKTDDMGNFSFQCHAAEGSLITIRVEKLNTTSQVSAIAGKTTEIVLH